MHAPEPPVSDNAHIKSDKDSDCTWRETAQMCFSLISNMHTLQDIIQIIVKEGAMRHLIENLLLSVAQSSCSTTNNPVLCQLIGPLAARLTVLAD